MTDQTAITVREMKLGSIQVDGPSGVVAQATSIAGELTRIVKERKLSRNINGREYVYVEGWTTMGGMLGIVPQEPVNSPPRLTIYENGVEEYEATIELIRVVDGAVIGRASAICSTDEQTWSKRPRYARRSMAQTRACGKAYRLGMSWIMQLAGFAPTPAEEMDDVTDGEFRHVEAPKQAPRTDPNNPGAAMPPARTNGNSKPAAWNPVQALVDGGICENAPAAAALLNKHIPAQFRNEARLLEWGHIYRDWRNAGSPVEAAAENATNGAKLE